MFKMTDIKLQLTTDIDMFQFIENGMRGGISYIPNRNGEANKKYMKNCDTSKPSKYIMYQDANNLYGWAMSQCLPTGGFKWMRQKKIGNTNPVTYTEDSKKGLILEVDLEYPSNLHKKNIMIILLLLRKLESIRIFCQIIVKLSEKNMELPVDRSKN